MTKSIIILVKPEDKEYLDTLKEHPRETYGDIIHRLIECWKREHVMPGDNLTVGEDGEVKSEPTKEFVTPDPDSPTGIKEPETAPDSADNALADPKAQMDVREI